MNDLDLGISQDELREQIVERASQKLTDYVIETEGDSLQNLQPAHNTIEKIVGEQVDTFIENELRPVVEKGVENVIFDFTNQYGEKKGQSLTFREYLVQRAEEYLTEKVNYDGKSKREDSMARPTQPRITYMIDRMIHSRIEKAMKDAIEDFDRMLQQGLSATVNQKLSEIAKNTKISIKR